MSAYARTEALANRRGQQDVRRKRGDAQQPEQATPSHSIQGRSAVLVSRSAVPKQRQQRNRQTEQADAGKRHELLKPGQQVWQDEWHRHQQHGKYVSQVRR